jgi:hypothetical protein
MADQRVCFDAKPHKHYHSGDFAIMPDKEPPITPIAREKRCFLRLVEIWRFQLAQLAQRPVTRHFTHFCVPVDLAH